MELQEPVLNQNSRLCVPALLKEARAQLSSWSQERISNPDMSRVAQQVAVEDFISHQSTVAAHGCECHTNWQLQTDFVHNEKDKRRLCYQPDSSRFMTDSSLHVDKK